MHTSAGETESETESRAKPEPGRDIRAHPVQVIVLCENNCCLCVYVCLSDAGIFGFRFCTRDLYTWAFNKFSANFSPACAFIKTGSVRVPPAEGIPGFSDLAFSILVLGPGIRFEFVKKLRSVLGISHFWQEEKRIILWQDFNHINPAKVHSQSSPSVKSPDSLHLQLKFSSDLSAHNKFSE